MEIVIFEKTEAKYVFLSAAVGSISPRSHCRVEQFFFLCFDHSVVHSLIEWFFSLCYFIRRSLKTEPACSNPRGAIVESSETP